MPMGCLSISLEHGLGHFCQRSSGAVFPELPKDFQAITQVPAIRGEDLKGNCVIVTDSLERTDVMIGFERSGAQREVQISIPTFVIVQVDMSQTFSISGQEFVCGIQFDQQIGMADIEMKSQF